MHFSPHLRSHSIGVIAIGGFVLKFGRCDEKDNFIQGTTSYLNVVEIIQHRRYCPFNNAYWANLDNEQSTIEEQ